MSIIFSIPKMAWCLNRPLTVLAWLAVGGLIISALGLIIDPRCINGELAWIKPIKFSASFFAYAITLVWLTQFLQSRAFQITSATAAVSAAVELTAISFQSARGVIGVLGSGNIIDQALFLVIKAAIFPVAFALVASFILLLKRKDLPPVIDSALHWGVFIAIAGCVPAVLMVLPEPFRVGIIAHAQNAAASGKLPFLGWSTVTGDLRAAHFVGIHGLQVLPTIGIAVTTFLKRLSNVRQQAIVWNAGFTYLMIIGILTSQALRAESIVSLSSTTMFAVATLALFSSGAAILTICLPESSFGGLKKFLVANERVQA